MLAAVAAFVVKNVFIGNAETIQQTDIAEETPAAVVSGSPATAPSQPEAIRRGTFIDADSIHKGSGSVTVERRANGEHVLKFGSDFKCCSDY